MKNYPYDHILPLVEVLNILQPIIQDSPNMLYLFDKLHSIQTRTEWNDQLEENDTTSKICYRIACKI